MRLIVFHYHLLPGGVTQVIKSAAIAALRYIPGIDGITLVSGKSDNSGKVVSEIRDGIKSFISNADVDSVTIPELGYISDMDNYPDPGILTDTLLNRFKGDLWWIHNYHIGKNPFFTEAVLQIAEHIHEQHIVLHIHDFPEAARYLNLEALHTHVTMPLYPVSSNIKYVTINGRDREFLTAAGIPEEMVFLLNNPVEPLEREKGEWRKETGRRIEKVLSRSSSSYIKGAPLIIYPVRTIRRKNILEAGLLARCSRTPVNLLVTLPGVSETEKGYSDLVDICFNSGLIPGAAQAGLKAAEDNISFLDLIDAGNLIISSSVQEGFGYLFINSLQWNRPLFARDLKIIDGFREIFQKKESYFYNEIVIPLGKSLKELLSKEYSRKIREVETILDNRIISSLNQNIKLLLQMNTIDFSYLSPSMQIDFLKHLADPGLLKETRRLNIININMMEKILSKGKTDFEKETIERFSLSNHAEQIQKIISSFEDRIAGNIHTMDIQDNMLKSFAELSSIRLLYDPV